VAKKENNNYGGGGELIDLSLHHRERLVPLGRVLARGCKDDVSVGGDLGVCGEWAL
jgi:hypothetical protein